MRPRNHTTSVSPLLLNLMKLLLILAMLNRIVEYALVMVKRKFLFVFDSIIPVPNFHSIIVFIARIVVRIILVLLNSRTQNDWPWSVYRFGCSK